MLIASLRRASTLAPPLRSALLLRHSPLIPLACCAAALAFSPPSAWARRHLSAGRGLQTAALAFFPPSEHQQGQIRQRRSDSEATSGEMAILESPSAERNKGPIWDVLSSVVLPFLSPIGRDEDNEEMELRVLEVAAGCGVHTVHFASSYLANAGDGRRGIFWQPTDPDEQSRASIDARLAALPVNSAVRSAVRPAAELLLGDPGATGIQDGVVTRYVGKIPEEGGRKGDNVGSPLRRILGDDEGSADLMICINMVHIAPWCATLGLMSCASAALRSGGVLYCYGPFKVGGTAVESNLNFDRSLRMRDPSWGVRDLEEVKKVANENGLELVKVVEMPANNLSVIFRKS